MSEYEGILQSNPKSLGEAYTRGFVYMSNENGEYPCVVMFGPVPEGLADATPPNCAGSFKTEKEAQIWIDQESSRIDQDWLDNRPEDMVYAFKIVQLADPCFDAAIIKEVMDA